MKRNAIAVSLLGTVAYAADAVPSYVAKAVADVGRTPLDMVRDADRKPAEALAFSGVKPNDVVVDFVPGGGYYTRILSKIVGPKGKVYALVPLRGGAPGQVRAAEAKDRAAGKTVRDPVDAVLEIQNLTDYSNVEVLWEPLYTYGAEFSVPQQVDVVWTSDNYHDLHNPNFVEPTTNLVSDGPGLAPIKGSMDIVKLDKLIFESLKPGGVFLILDHAAAKGAGTTQTGTLHRIDPDSVKAELTQAGFVLDGESKALANPADDHTKNVRELHDKTDQFILRFKKPANASPETHRPPANAMNGFYGNTSQSGGDPAKDPTHRWVFYHPNGTYEEYGISGSLVQQGEWYWDAAGHNCMIHQFPGPERQGIVCHATATFKKAGDVYTQDNGGSTPRPYALTPGYTQPTLAEVKSSRAE
jgi:predicted methyltransferase